MFKRHLFTCLIFCLLSSFTAATALADALVPDEYRIKIDSVETDNAPNIRIRATFLDDISYPIDPDANITINVLADDEQLKVVPKLTSFKTTDLPLDLAFVLPITERFKEKDLEKIKETFSNILKQARPTDRVAGFFDDGRSINRTGLGPATEVEAVLGTTKPISDASFLYSSLDMALEALSDPATYRPKARRAIILVTDAFDTYTYVDEDVKKAIIDAYQYAKQYDIKIYVVMYQPLLAQLAPMFEGLSRKTGGTYRYATSINDIGTNISYAWGEIYGQIVIDFKHPGLRENDEIKYSLEATAPGGVFIKSRQTGPVTIKELQFDWVIFSIVMGVIVGILLVLLIVFLIIRHHQKLLEQEEAAREEQALQEGIERGEVCPKCRRKMMPDWKECMFCAREAAEELNKAKAEQRQKAIEEAEKKGIKLEGRVCSKCGRTLMPQWTECLFCKAGIGGSGSAKGAAPLRSKKEQKPEQPEGRVCPVCGKTMKAHWTTCLYCEADAQNRPATAPKPKEQAPAQPATRVCPTCGRPMKAHWTTCLYCESNRERG